MLLRRLIAHINNQNWFAVGLDLVVVILGIFLGMQVSDWNEQRKERLTEMRYIERLVENTDTNLQIIDQAIVVNQRLLEYNMFVNQRLVANEVTDAEWQKFKKVFPSLMVWRAIPFDRGFLDTLINAGEIRLITNEGTQDSITQLRAAYDDIDRQLNYFRDWATVLLPDMMPGIRYRVSPQAMADPSAFIDLTSLDRAMKTIEINDLAASWDEIVASDAASVAATLWIARSNWLNQLLQLKQQLQQTRALLVAQHAELTR